MKRIIRKTFAILAASVAISSSMTAQHSAYSQSGCTDDAMLVFDASGSMAEMGFNGLNLPRIFQAREAMHHALPRITPYRRLGLVVYGPGQNDSCSNVQLRLRPTENAAGKIISEIDSLQPDGNTPLTRSVELAAETLDHRKNSGVVVLVTDGQETCGGKPCELATQLAATSGGVIVHVIGFRVRDQFFQWKSQRDGQSETKVAVARCLADRTGGLYVSAETTDELIEALQQTLGCATTSELGGPQGRSRSDLRQQFG